MLRSADSGHNEPLARPSTPIISRESAIRAALDIIDEDGLGALSLERLADRLGVRAPSLYHHFNDKAEILLEVARLIMLETQPPKPLDESWIEFMVAQAVEFRRAVLKHANAASLLLEYLPRRMMLASYEREASMLRSAGVPAHLHVLLFEGADKMTLGSALYAASQQSKGDEASLFPGIDQDRDPLLTVALAANPWDDEALFAQSIRSFLRGAVDGSAEIPKRRAKPRKRS
jgi:TetR/AcrR family transcriptional regulator, tetracycline repressor protein